MPLQSQDVTRQNLIKLNPVTMLVVSVMCLFSTVGCQLSSSSSSTSNEFPAPDISGLATTESLLADVKASVVRIEKVGAQHTYPDKTSLYGKGSGFIFDPSGYIVTTNNVAGGAGETVVYLDNQPNGLSAELVGSAECSNLAVLKLASEGEYPALEWHTGPLQLQQTVYSAGYSLENSEILAIQQGTITTISDFVITHTAEMSVGAMGGALIDVQTKRIVGINTHKNLNSKIFVAVPTFSAQKIIMGDGSESLYGLINGQRFLSIGITGEIIFGSNGFPTGYWVQSVEPEFIADNTGLKPGDIITAIADERLGGETTANTYCSMMALTNPNNQNNVIPLEIKRGEVEVCQGELNGKALKCTSPNPPDAGAETPILENGVLTRDHLISETGSYYNVYYVEAKEGGIASVAMYSTDFDAAIEIWTVNIDGSSDQKLSADNNSAGGTDAFVQFSTDKNSTYEVRALAIPVGAVGNFSLELSTSLTLIQPPINQDNPNPRDDNAKSQEEINASVVRIEKVGMQHAYPGQTQLYGLGSGFIIDPNGYIVTKNHIAGGAKETQVFLPGQTKGMTAELVGSAECNDLAVLKLTSGNDYPFLDWYTDPLTLQQTVYTSGYSVENPENLVLNQGEITSIELYSLTHTANSLPGMFGGPVLDIKTNKIIAINGGEIIGSNAFFSTPVTTASPSNELLVNLKEGLRLLSIGIAGSVIRNDQGFSIGLWVQSVEPGFIADKAGLQANDVIVSIADESLINTTTALTYCNILQREDPNNPDNVISFQVNRGNTELCQGELNGIPLSCTPMIPSKPTYDYTTKIEGEFNNHSFVFVNGAYYNDYLVTAETDGVASITMSSSDLNIGIEVFSLNPDGLIDTMMAIDIKSDLGEDALVEFPVLKDVNYLIRASASEPEAIGGYTIQFSNVLIDVEPIVPPPKPTYTYNTKFEENLNEDSYTTDNNIYYDTYIVTTETSGIAAVMMNATDLDVKIEVFSINSDFSLNASIAVDDNSGEGPDALVEFPVADGAYYVVNVITLEPEATGGYTVQFSTILSDVEQLLPTPEPTISPLSGTWVGVWSDKSNQQAGVISLEIGDDGRVSGTIANTTVQLTSPITGAISEQGHLEFIYNYVGTEYFALGDLTHSIGTLEGLSGNLTFYLNNEPIGTAETAILKKTQ